MGINWVTGTFYKFNGGHKVEEGRYAVEGCHFVPLPPLQIQGENPTRTRAIASLSHVIILISS